jgi:sulfoxide reductase heme-binding subunit YedZ
MTGPNPIEYGWWLASRSAGVVALVAVSVSVIAGLLMANGLPRRPGSRRRLLTIHEATALTGLVAIAVHGLTLLGDRFMHPGLVDLAVPFTFSYRPLFTGLGVVAGWLAAILGLSFYTRRRIGARLWRRLHRATVLVWVLGVAHTLGAGTDAGERWLQVVVFAPAVPIVLFFLRRVLPAADRAAGGASRPARAASPSAADDPGPRSARPAGRLGAPAGAEAWR